MKKVFGCLWKKHNRTATGIKSLSVDAMSPHPSMNDTPSHSEQNAMLPHPVHFFHVLIFHFGQQIIIWRLYGVIAEVSGHSLDRLDTWKIFAFSHIGQCLLATDSLRHLVRWGNTMLPHQVPYLVCVTCKPHRKALSRFIMSSHCLCVETGRWRRPDPIPYERRYCASCRNKIEDEYHMLFECELYDELRNTLVPRYFRTRPSVFELIEFINSASYKQIRGLAKFVCNAFKIRSNLVWSMGKSLHMCQYLWIIHVIVDVLLLFCLISCKCDRPFTMLTMCVSFVFLYFTRVRACGL